MSGLISADKDGRARGISMGLKSASRRHSQPRMKECVYVSEWKNGSIDGEKGYFLSSVDSTHARRTLSLQVRGPNHSTGLIVFEFGFGTFDFEGF
jgi:hypothetical protein